MTILFVLVPAAFVLGLAVESHWCGHMHQSRKWEAVARREHAKLEDALAAAQRLGVPAQTPGNWVKNRRRGTSRRAS